MFEFIRNRLKWSTQEKPAGILTEMVSVCCCCHTVLENRKVWQKYDMSALARDGVVLSHGLCPDCYEEQREEYRKVETLLGAGSASAQGSGLQG